MENITQFFYNIVPGTIFLLIFFQISPNISIKIETISAPQAFLIVILSILMGFLSQAIFKLFRENWIDELIWTKIKKDNETISENVKEILIRKKLIGEQNHISINKQTFHMIDNYLEARKLSGYTTHFMPRVAFWSNLFILSFILLYCLVYKGIFVKNGMNQIEQMLGTTILPIILILSIYMTSVSLKAVYEVVLKTFASIYKLKSIED